MRILFLLSTAIVEDSMQVNTRNIRAIAEYLKIKGHTAEYLSIIPETDPVSSRKFGIFKSQQWDIIVSVYSSWYVHIDGVKEILGNQKDCLVGWLSTEYDLRAHGAYEPWDFYLTNFDEAYFTRGKAKRKYQDYRMLNFNALVAKVCEPEQLEKKHDILYYGRYREGRGDYFKRYFDGRIKVSTSKKNISKFSRHGCTADWYGPIDWTPGRETLRHFRCSLYIEDVITHSIFNNLANRFYEALSCDTVPIFDVTCTATIQKSGYEIPERWIVASPGELHDRVAEISADWPTHHAHVRTLARRSLEERSLVLDALEKYLVDVRERLTPARNNLAALVRDPAAAVVESSSGGIETGQ